MDARRHTAGHHDVDSGTGLVLWRPGTQQKHAVRADAGVFHIRADHRAVGRVWLFDSLHPGQRLLRRLRSRVAERHLRPRHRRRRQCRHLQQGRVHSRVRLRRIPGDLRGHHRGPDRRRVRGAHEVLGRAAVLGAVVHLLLPADGPHGLVLARSGCVHRCGCGRGGRCRLRLAVPEGCARFCRWHRRAHQRRCRRSGGRLCDRQARRLRS